MHISTSPQKNHILAIFFVFDAYIFAIFVIIFFSLEISLSNKMIKVELWV